jgi:hypothetical protein
MMDIIVDQNESLCIDWLFVEGDEGLISPVGTWLDGLAADNFGGMTCSMSDPLCVGFSVNFQAADVQCTVVAARTMGREHRYMEV